MPRPTVKAVALASAVAAELAVGTLLVAPTAFAEDAPTSTDDPGAPSAEPDLRTGRSDDAPPAPAAPVEVPDAPAAPVRTGRVGDVPELVGEPDGDAPPEPTTTTPPPESPNPTSTPDRQSPDGGQSDGSRRPANDEPGDGSPGTPSTPPAAPTTTGTPPLPTAHTVVAGDNLWEIAAAHLALATARMRTDLGALDIAPYWTRVCMQNRERLRSGNVNLIYAGEVIDLPTP
jgi:hypothetical protein